MMARVISTTQYPGAEGLPFAANLNHSQNRSLTDPEAHILLLLKAGKERSEIAADVGADEAAVKEHIKAILRKAIGSSSQRPDREENCWLRAGSIQSCCGALRAQRTVGLGVENSFRDTKVNDIRTPEAPTSCLEPCARRGTLAQDGLLVKALPVLGDDL